MRRQKSQLPVFHMNELNTRPIRHWSTNSMCYKVPSQSLSASYSWLTHLYCSRYRWLVQESRNSNVLAMELRLSCTNPSIYCIIGHFHDLLYKTSHNMMCENDPNTTHTGTTAKVVNKPLGDRTRKNIGITMFKISVTWLYSDTFWATIFKHFGHTFQLQLWCKMCSNESRY